MFDENRRLRRKSRKAGRRSCSTPTANGKSATIIVEPQTRRSIPAKDKRIVPGSGPYAVDAVTGRRLDLVHRRACSVGRRRFLRFFDPATGLSEVFNVPAAGVRKSAVAISTRNGVVWASFIEWSPRQL